MILLEWFEHDHALVLVEALSIPSTAASAHVFLVEGSRVIQHVPKAVLSEGSWPDPGYLPNSTHNINTITVQYGYAWHSWFTTGLGYTVTERASFAYV